MLDIANEFGYRVTAFHHAIEAYKIAPLLAADGVCADMWTGWWGFKMEALDAVEENAALVDARRRLLRRHPLRRRRTDPAPEPGGRRRPRRRSPRRPEHHRGTRDQLDHPRTPPARIGIGDETGSLEPGKRADVVIWSADPFSVYARADQVFIDGALTFDRIDPRLSARRPTSNWASPAIGLTAATVTAGSPLMRRLALISLAALALSAALRRPGLAQVTDRHHRRPGPDRHLRDRERHGRHPRRPRSSRSGPARPRPAPASSTRAARSSTPGFVAVDSGLGADRDLVGRRVGRPVQRRQHHHAPRSTSAMASIPGPSPCRWRAWAASPAPSSSRTIRAAAAGTSTRTTASDFAGAGEGGYQSPGLFAGTGRHHPSGRRDRHPGPAARGHGRAVRRGRSRRRRRRARGRVHPVQGNPGRGPPLCPQQGRLRPRGPARPVAVARRPGGPDPGRQRRRCR